MRWWLWCVTGAVAGVCGHAIAAEWPPVPYPHPIISEVLYAVPTGDRGDASGDGTRHVSGDEFIEIVNPHDRTIKLGGYVVTDRNVAGRGQLRFAFPKLSLEPGQVVVVFNGNEQDWAKLGGLGEGVGDSSRAVKEGNARFGGAIVLTMGITSQREAWANGGDYALLTSPEGDAVQCVTWGDYDVPTPAASCLHEAPESSESVQWDPAAGAFAEHSTIDGRLFSPGEFECPAAAVAEAGTGASAGGGDEPAPAEPKAEDGDSAPPYFVGPMPLQDPDFVGPPILD